MHVTEFMAIVFQAYYTNSTINYLIHNSAAVIAWLIAFYLHPLALSEY